MDGKDDKNKDDDRAGLIGQVASPNVETEPRLNYSVGLDPQIDALWHCFTHPKETSAHTYRMAIEALIAAVRSGL